MTEREERPLSPQAATVAGLIADAWLDKQIAATIKVSPQRVRQIVMEIAETWSLDRRRNIRAQIVRRVVSPPKQSAS